MATSSSYYLNAPSLGSATAVFTDEALSVCAPDGFYSNGSIVREQVGCVLLPQQTCPSCATPCGETINASGGQGIYLLDLDTGSTGGDVGAVIVRFDPYSVPDGIRATLGTNVYNALTSSVDGFHQSATAGNFTYIGQIGGDCGISGTTYPALTEYSYIGTSFVATGGTQSVTVAPGDVSLGASSPGSCLMVIPKLTASPSVINFEVVGPCSGTAWQMSVDCPVLLTGFSSSVSALTEEAVCELSETTTYYNASLADTPGTVGLYDFVFADAYGSTPLPAGYYKATGSITGSNDWFQVGSNGIVVALGVCVAPPPEEYTIDNSATGTALEACDGSTTTSTVYALPGYTVPIVGMIFYNSTSLTTPFVGSAGWRKLTKGATTYAVEVDVNGELLNYITCSTIPEVSYNCVDGTCTDPGDGTGTYATLIECETACAPPPPECLDRRVVFQICNSNSAKDDNFDIYLNDVYIGAVDLNSNSQVGSVFIADTNTAVNLGSSDFACPLESMVTYHFNPAIVLGENVLEMRNTQNNENGNFGTVGVRNYLLTGTTLSDPCVIANLNYSGASGSSFTFNFSYTQCCPEVSYNCVDGSCIDPNDGTGTYATLEACEAACSAPAGPTVTGLGAGFHDELGEFYVDSSVTVDSAVLVETLFEVSVATGIGNISVYVTIAIGGTYGTGSTYVGMSSPGSASDPCVASCDNPSVNLSTFGCAF